MNMIGRGVNALFLRRQSRHLGIRTLWTLIIEAVSMPNGKAFVKTWHTGFSLARIAPILAASWVAQDPKKKTNPTNHYSGDVTAC